ncbi:MAG TPA: FAD-binding oxidoreductase [Thermoprotei archaeon]|nr:FAD-binding oxidoreductase [Thermoprotei archaeon]
MRRYSVIVIGLGSTGSSILYNLVKMGYTDVLAIESRCPGCGQTSRSSALIRLHYTNPVLRDMAIYSWSFWRRYGLETGYYDVFHETGVGFGGGDIHIDVMEEIYQALKRRGVDVEMYQPSSFRNEYYKDLDIDGLSIVVWESGSGYCDAYDSVQGFVRYALESGVDIRVGEEVIDFIVGDDTIYKVVTNKGVYDGEYIINASGVWTNKLLSRLNIKLPIEIAREDVLYVKQPRDGIGFGWGDFIYGFYGRPDGGSRYLIGGLEPIYNGFDPEPGEYRYPPIELVKNRLGNASKRFPKLNYVEPISAIYGYYDVTPDYQPILGFDIKYRNLIHIVGLSGHGFKLAPAYGVVAAELVKYGVSRSFDIIGLGLDRFLKGIDQHSKYKYGIIG